MGAPNTFPIVRGAALMRKSEAGPVPREPLVLEVKDGVVTMVIEEENYSHYKFTMPISEVTSKYDVVEQYTEADMEGLE